MRFVPINQVSFARSSADADPVLPAADKRPTRMNQYHQIHRSPPRMLPEAAVELRASAEAYQQALFHRAKHS